MFNACFGLDDMVPGAVEGWTIALEDKSYTPVTLHEYINGGAELYISYGFKQSFSRKYIIKDQSNILVDLFDMGTSKNAFGVFSYTRETEDRLFGQGSQYVSGSLLFWKDRYFVSIFASPETVQSKEAVFRIAEKIETAISVDGPLPGILELLPKDRLIHESIFYFHHHIWLNAYYFIAHENILHVDSNTEAVFAKYNTPEIKSILLIIKYPSETESKRASSDFIKHYLPELSKTATVKTKNNTWTGLKHVRKYLVIFFNAPDKNTGLTLINKTIKNL
jgi:hypothetical protein